MNLLRLVLAGLLCALAARAEGGDWEQKIQPLLARRCYRCHGPDAVKREGQLRLDRAAELLRPRQDGPLVTPGRPQQSVLWRRVSSDDPDERMPPGPDHPPLTAGELEQVRKWITAGAKLAEHWSHRPVQRPQLPPAGDSVWPRNPIDLFALQQLRSLGDAPPRRASREQLARRLALTLTGMPPSPATARLLTDTSPPAIARYVDHLLASPAYGEHMAVAWLDLARYADTHGYHIDGRRDMWRWRDWVIESLNANMPFDRFTIEQLAGDLLPAATMRQRLATGLLRNNMINSEDGAIGEEFLAEYAAERTIAVGTIWLGQTMQCCRCHDHKNDPLSQRDFYRLSAFFNDLPELGVDGRKGNAAPLLRAPTRPQQRRWSELRERVDGLVARLGQRLQQPRDAAQQQWERRTLAAGPRPAPPATAQLELDDGEGRRAVANNNGPAARLQGTTFWTNGRQGGAVLMSGAGRIHWRLPPQQDFTVACWMFRTTGDRMTLLSLGRPALQLQLEAKQGLRLVEEDQPLSLTPAEGGWQKRNKWQHLAWTHRGGRHTVYLDGVKSLSWREPADPELRTGESRSRTEIELPLWIGGAGDDAELTGGLRGMVDDIRAFDRGLSADELLRLAGADPLREALAMPAAERDEAARRRLRREFLLASDPRFAELDRRRQQTLAEMDRLAGEFPTAMVMRTGPRRPTHVLERGDYRRRRDLVQRGVPYWMPPLPDDGPTTRLDLARWLVSPEHPLTARVVANRVWQAHFGVGLAPTVDDLGLGGVAPQHPELLDYLASELIASGWDLKHLHRLVVTSAVFLQSSPHWPGTPASSRQLPAEVLRDSALAASGALARQLGGPSVFPYQPSGLWEELARDPNLYSAQVYRQDHGAGLYRRSVYTFWKRSSPPPSLQLLGAPSRETCTPTRTPVAGVQQALVLLNDPTFVEAARLLAQRIVRQQGEQPRIAWGFQQLFVRDPSAAEARRLAALLKALREHYRGQPAAAKQLLEVGSSPLNSRAAPAELAAWTAWCNTLMNTHEFQTLP